MEIFLHLQNHFATMNIVTMTDNKTLAFVLEKKGRITTDQAKEIHLEHLQSGRSEEEILKEKKFVPKVDLLQAKSELYNVPFIDLEKVGFDPVSVSLIPRSVAEKYKLIPFDLDKKLGSIKVAMANPLDLETVEFLERKTSKRIFPHLAAADQIKKMIVIRYEQELTSQVKEAMAETERREKVTDLNDLDKVVREAPVAKIVSTILQFAMRSRSSDVHIEPQEEDSRVRYRIDGILHEKLILPKNVHDAVVSRIKILADLKIDERRVPQDGRFNFRADDQEIDLRVSTAPTIHGEKVVMRLLKKQSKIPELQELGLRGRALKNVQEAMIKPQGLIVVCGPTGSGKTTTLYSALSKVSTTKVNVITIEDPVEYQMEQVSQVQVNPQAGLTFASALRSFLRQDPDIIMVGEIRDEETAQLAIHASLTGHLVFSTLHTNDASGTPPRMIDMGAEPFLLISALTLVVAQRVLRKVCLACKESYTPDENAAADVKRVLGDLYPIALEQQEKQTRAKGLTLWRGKGCEECNNTGYIGRIGIFEVMPIEEELSKLISRKASAGEIDKLARQKGMMSMKQDGYMKVLEGITTIEEVLRVAEF